MIHIIHTIQIIHIIHIIQIIQIQCHDEDRPMPGARSSDAAANGLWCPKTGTSTATST